ncbi:hypothetical protein EDD76_10697 [Kineothrix alysoides]|uniref:Uncharacterized protein n=1 Tax=Kineothrix alysoides TaxID=1469948 RepID=A0A4R1QZL5_9FIRM|nr:hypothetical protein [Kineothrix alysoides]TCL58444.1 hypothetical protein EDD76_10697 [Kineothrix alysoides]
MHVIIWLAIELICLILGSIFHNTVFYGAAFISIGIVMFVCIKQGFSLNNKALAIIGFFFLLFGTAIAAEPLVQKETNFGSTYLMFVFGIGMGIIFIALGMFGISKHFLCRVRLEGTFEHWTMQSGKGRSWYVPQFSYVYDKRHYRNTSGELYSTRKMKHKYIKGNLYPIYINAKNPTVFRTRQTFPVSNLFYTLLGILFIYVPFTCV